MTVEELIRKVEEKSEGITWHVSDFGDGWIAVEMEGDEEKIELKEKMLDKLLYAPFNWYRTRKAIRMTTMSHKRYGKYTCVLF